jgi:hypothetical protein
MIRPMKTVAKNRRSQQMDSKFCILIGIDCTMIILCSSDCLFVLQRELLARDSAKHKVRPNGRGHIAKEAWMSPERTNVHIGLVTTISAPSAQVQKKGILCERSCGWQWSCE